VGEQIIFRGLRGRTLDDQQRAIAAGYESMQDYAIDELGQLVLTLMRRVEALEEAARSRWEVTPYAT
jgi:hypothetical protein